MTDTARRPCTVPGCPALIHPQELCCGPHWHPLTSAAKEAWFAATCAHLRGVLPDEELRATAARSLGLEPVPEEAR